MKQLLLATILLISSAAFASAEMIGRVTCPGKFSMQLHMAFTDGCAGFMAIMDPACVYRALNPNPKVEPRVFTYAGFTGEADLIFRERNPYNHWIFQANHPAGKLTIDLKTNKVEHGSMGPYYLRHEMNTVLTIEDAQGNQQSEILKECWNEIYH